MSETTGVTNGGGSEHRPSGPPKIGGGAGGFFKKNKLAVIGGGALAALLLMSRKGAASANAGSSPNAQLQAASDLAAAQDAAALNAGSAADAVPNTGPDATVDEDPEGSRPGTGQVGPNITVNVGGGPAVHKKPPHPKPKPKVHPKTGPHGKTPPAHKNPNHHGTPHHKPTHHKTPAGTKHHSPALVESVDGAGSGVTVFGRDFPGALGHRLGPPQREPSGRIMRRVMVDYGGHTDTHIAHGSGDLWTDNAAGHNPPSRGVPTTTEPVPR